MTTHKTSPQTPELLDLPGIPKSPKLKTDARKLGNSRIRNYKGGRVLPYARRFRTWREVQGYSLIKMAAKLEPKTREYGIDGRYLLTRLYDMEQGRFKPPTWLILLLMDTYEITFPWSEFHE